MASVTKRGKVWYARVEYPRQADGSRDQRAIPCPGLNKRETLEFARRKESEIRNGASVDAGRLLLRDYLRTWLESARLRIAPTTWQQYRAVIENHIEPALGYLVLERLQAYHVQAFCDQLSAAERVIGKNEEGEDILARRSAKTVRNIVGVLKAALNQAVKQQLISRNVADLIDLPKYQKPPTRFATPEDLRNLLESGLAGSKYRLPMLIAIGTGLRRGEILGLQWGDFDAARALLIVRRSLAQVKGDIIVKETKTGRPRVVALPQATVELLEACKEELNGSVRPDDWVCTDEHGKPLSPRGLTGAFRRFASKHQVGTTFHGLRHGQGTLLAAAGVPFKDIAERLGHSTVHTTQEFYIHPLPETQRLAARIVDQLMRSRESDNASSNG